MAPLYYYENPKTGEIKEILQSMSEEHIYSEDGLKFNRVWVNPQLNVKGNKIDPFSSKDFVEKTARMKGTYGDMLDYSKEQSEARAAKNGGVDPVQRKFFDNYEKENGVKHTADKKKKFENSLLKVELD